MLQQIGLYYPYIHVRNEQWLKTAALYWPKLARIVPDDYPLADSAVVHALADELDFIVPVSPVSAARVVAPMFLEVLERHQFHLRQQYGYFGSVRDDDDPPLGIAAHPRPPTFLEPPYLGTGTSFKLPHREIAGLYWDEVASELRDALFDAGLAMATRRSRFGQVNPHPWVAMDAALAWVYKCVFIETLSRQGGFAPTTDLSQRAAYGASEGWDADRISRALLHEWGSEARAPRDLASAVGMLAVRVAMPEDPDIPIQRIIRLRQRHRAEFEAFSAAVTEAVTTLQAEFVDLTLPAAREAYAQMEVERRFEIPLQDLRAAMKGIGITTVFSAANLKFELPAAVAAVAGGAIATQPFIGAALGAAFTLVGIRRTASQQRQAALTGSPAAYLLSIERDLSPPRLLTYLVGLPARI